MKLARLAVAVVTLAAASALPAGARADEPTEVQLDIARERFREGVALEEAGDFAEARAKFELVRQTTVSPQVLYHLAFCDEQLGALVAALAGYREAIVVAERVGSSAAAVIEEARPRLADLETRVPRLRVTIDGELAPGDQVTVDGAPQETWAEGVAVDPGRRVVALVRDGATLAEATVEAAEGARATARLVIVAPAAPEAPPPIPPPPPEPDHGGGPPAAALIVGGVGVAAVVVGGVTLAMQQVAIEDVRSSCADPEAGTGCDPRTRAREDDARTLGVTGGILLGVGAACIATGVVLWITLDDEPAPPGPTARGVALAPGPLGVVASGRF